MPRTALSYSDSVAFLGSEGMQSSLITANPRSYVPADEAFTVALTVSLSPLTDDLALIPVLAGFFVRISLTML